MCEIVCEGKTLSIGYAKRTILIFENVFFFGKTFMKYLYHEIGQTQGITIGFPKTLFTFLYFRFRLYLHGSTVGSLLSVLLEYFMAIFFSQKVGFKLSN